MSIEDAIKNITAFVDAYAEIIPRQVVKTLDVLKDAAKKQIPQKPVWFHNNPPIPGDMDDDFGYKCPCCGSDDIDENDHHCKCGQALLWEET